MMKVTASTVRGVASAPPSKSYTHRAVALALLTDRTRILEPLLSEDPRASLACAERLGARVAVGDGFVEVEGGKVLTPDDVLDCLNSGTTIRIFTALAALAPGHAVLTGDASLRKRPMQPLLDALRQQGAEAFSTRGNGLAPVVVKGPLRGGECAIPGDVSSQYVTALLLAGTQAPADTRLRLTSPLKSRPYVDITLGMLRDFGGRAEGSADGFRVPGGQRLNGTTYRVPGDFSTAAFPLAAAAITGGDVRVDNLNLADPQGDKAIVAALRAFGADVREADGAVTCRGGARLKGIRMDLSDTPDMFPILCALAAHAGGETVLSGAKHLRFKESDRIAAMVRELRKMGVDCEEREDGAIVRGGPVRGAAVHTYEDHRILMALAVCGLGATGETTLDEHESCAVSYPRFIEDLRRLGANVEVGA